MTNRRRKTSETPEERARWQAHLDETTRRLEARIAYHRAKIEEERVRKERREQLLARLLPWRA